MKKINWQKYGFEFLSIFIAVIAAFALNNWNDNRKAHQAETKILMEISNGLEKDLQDVKINMFGHESCISACVYWKKLLTNQEVSLELDSLVQNYFSLTRDFISIQNRTGYETLKSRGLELIANDSLRTQIISLYEYDFNILTKFEEQYYEMQFQENYFMEFNSVIAPAFQFDKDGRIVGIELPLKINETERRIIRSYLWKMRANIRFILGFYKSMDQRIIQLRKAITEEMQA